MLTAEQQNHWQNSGWLHIAQALDTEQLQATRSEVDRLANTPAETQGLTHYFEETGSGRKLCRTERYLEHSDQLHALICNGVLCEIASGLLNDRALLFKEKINYKMAGGAGFSAHQDATAYDFVSHHVTCLLALDAMTVENGCLAFANYQNKTLLPTNTAGCIDETVAETLQWQPIEARPGDLIYFDSYTPHKSGKNSTSRSRSALYLTYNAEKDGDMRLKYYENRDSIVRADNSRISTIGHFNGQNITTGTSQ